MNKVIVYGGILIAVVLAIVGIVSPVASPSGETPQAGASTPGTRFPHGVTIGLPANSPTNLSKVVVATANAIGMDASQAATTTASYDYAVTGVVSTDFVTSVMLSTTTQATLLTSNWVVASAKASTTAGFVTVRLVNLTGGTATPSASAVGSSTVITVVSTQ